MHNQWQLTLKSGMYSFTHALDIYVWHLSIHMKNTFYNNNNLAGRVLSGIRKNVRPCVMAIVATIDEPLQQLPQIHSHIPIKSIPAPRQCIVYLRGVGSDFCVSYCDNLIPLYDILKGASRHRHTWLSNSFHYPWVTSIATPFISDNYTPDTRQFRARILLMNGV